MHRVTRTSFHVIAASLGIAFAYSVVPVTPASALSAYDIQLKGNVVHAGGMLPVKVTRLYQGTSCKLGLVGPKKTIPVVARVKNETATAKLRAPAGPVGIYRVRAACGKNGTALSDPVMVVAASSPMAATCDVTESGFTMDSNGIDVTWGAVVRNASPELSATSVELAFSFKDASGAVVATTSERPTDIAPGGTVLVGERIFTAPGAVSLTVASRCETSLDPADPAVLGTGVIATDRWGDNAASGQFVNGTNYTWARSSDLQFVFRNGNGSVAGGGSEYLDAFVPPGQTATWSAWVPNDRVTPSFTVQSMVAPSEQS